MNESFGGFGQENVFAFGWAKGYPLFGGGVGEKWSGSSRARFPDRDVIGTVRLAPDMNVMGAVRGRMEFDSAWKIGGVGRERGAKSGA